MNLLIQLRDIAYRVGKRNILHDITLPITAGELLTIVGPNGAGKSTLLHLILGHIKPTNGNIKRATHLKMAYVPQSFHTAPDFPITMRRFLKDIKNAVENPILHTLKIAHLLDTPLQNLSGGETQRLLLARAMLTKPNLIALDEPAAGIDPAALGSYYQTIRDYQVQNQCAIVMVSHDLHLVMAASDQVICLNGHICCAGHPETIAMHPEFRAITGLENIGIYKHRHEHTHL